MTTHETHSTKQHVGKANPTGFYRVQVVQPGGSPQGIFPDTVVKAKDEAEAEARGFKELGIISINKAENQVSITPASEADYLKAQARRLGVDLRSQRQLKQSDGSALPAEAPDYGKLTWAPEGHKLAKTYWVSDQGELSDKKPEKEG